MAGGAPKLNGVGAFGAWLVVEVVEAAGVPKEKGVAAFVAVSLGLAVTDG